MSSPTLSHSPTPLLRDIEELSKQLNIARKRQEVEYAAQIWHKEKKEQCKHEEKKWKEHEEAVQKEAEEKAQCKQEEVEKHTCKKKGKEKVCGMSISDLHQTSLMHGSWVLVLVLV